MDLGLNFDFLGLEDGEISKRQGIEVEHEMKDKIREIVPENYNILGQISMQVVGTKTINKRFSESKELSRKVFGYYKNIRNLTKKTEKDDNPYDTIMAVKELKKEELKLNLNLKQDYKALLMQTYKINMFHEKTVYINILIFEEVQNAETDFLAGLDLGFGGSIETKSEEDETLDFGFGDEVA